MAFNPVPKLPHFRNQFGACLPELRRVHLQRQEPVDRICSRSRWDLSGSFDLRLSRII